MAQATPAISAITRHGRAPEDAFQDATHRVIRHLWKLRSDASASVIGNYVHYVKVIASHVIKGQVRQEHPTHRRLVDALRYVLKRHLSLALWTTEGQLQLCGLAEWRTQPKPATCSERLMQLVADPRLVEHVVHVGRNGRRVDYADLLLQLFRWIGHPIAFDQLARLMAGMKLTDTFTSEIDPDAWTTVSQRVPDARPRPDEQAEWREFLGRVWVQIEHLPQPQRVAYALNFTAGDGQLELFPAYGIASIGRIGAALALTDEHFGRAWPALDLPEDELRRAQACARYDDKFVWLWRYLPLPDAVIACMLGVERQKIINLRKAAGDRLSRRLGSR